jgi:hypothetical protein
MVRPAVVLPLIAALGAGAPGCRTAPDTLAGCAALPDAAEADACSLALALPLVDDPPALRAAVATLPGPAERDLLLLRLAVHRPTRAGEICALVTTAGAREKCQQVLGRPHLGSAPRPPVPP